MPGMCMCGYSGVKLGRAWRERERERERVRESLRMVFHEFNKNFTLFKTFTMKK